MPKFSKSSEEKLSTCHYMLQVMCKEAIQIMDFKVIWGHRNKEQQNSLYPKFTTKKFPDSKHNSDPSLAIDLAPYPIDWSDLPRFYILAGVMLALAKRNNVKLRWGGDWDGDGDLSDQKFNDLGHFEIDLGGA